MMDLGGIIRKSEIDYIANMPLDKRYITKCEEIEDYVAIRLKGMEGVGENLEEFRELVWDFIWEGSRCRMLFKHYKDGEVIIKPFLNTGIPTIAKHRIVYELALFKLLDIENEVEDGRQEVIAFASK